MKRDDERLLLETRRRRRLRRQRASRRRHAATVALVLAAAAAVVVLATVGTGAALSAGCNLSTLRPVHIGENSFVYAADGTRLGSIPADRNREPVTLTRIGPWLPKATVAVEDRRFYKHGGVDYVGIARAFWSDLSAGRVVQGGSTITQQLVRNVYVGKERTFGRKIKEACLAIKLSDRWSKDRILQEYLNTVYYGNHAYGVEAAAQTYFSKHARELNLRQAALLAGLPQAPSDYDPLHNPSAAIARRNQVLYAMLANHSITEREYRWASRSTNLGLKPGSEYTRIKEPYFFSYVINELQSVYGANTVREGGLRVYTTIDPRLQSAASKAIRSVLNLHDDPAASVVSVEPGTGAIRAMAAVIPGNTTNQFNLAAQSRREAGSTFKAFVLASAIEQGIDPDHNYYLSAPFTCTKGPWCEGDYAAGKPWQVTTYSGSYQGWTSITHATLSSDNTVFAQLTLDAGPDRVWRMAKRLGIELNQKPVASIGLGPLAVSPLEMAGAYATFSAGGIYAKPTAIAKVILADGKVDSEAGWGTPSRKRVLSPGVAWKVTDILHQNAMYGTGAGSGDGTHPNAGKTGTTEDHADAWFVGYTRGLSTAVWMGYPGGEIPMVSVHGRAVAGATFPVPIWHAYMTVAEAGKPARDFLAPKHFPTYRPFTRGNFGYSVDLTPTTTTTPTFVTPKAPRIVEPKPGRPVPQPARPNKPAAPAAKSPP